jgi:hypothetical protein
MSVSPALWRTPLLCVAALAAVAGAWLRFRGLSFAPFSVDEYYLAQSIAGVVRTGLPRFVCGGLYMRGLILQYGAAALQLSGASAEFAPRVLCALSSMVALPAVYLLGKRVHGRLLGLLAFTLCALSVWEIEMARFGRMYAPFQALFLWYTVFFLRYTADGDRRALWPMIALSIAGPLVWEGGIFLALANLLALFLRYAAATKLRRADWLTLGGCVLLFGLVYWFLASDFRGYRADSWPPGYNTLDIVAERDKITLLSLPLSALKQHAAWLVLSLIPLLATAFGARRIWEYRANPLLCAALLVMLLAPLVHQLLLALAVALVLPLTPLIDGSGLANRRLWPLYAAMALSTAFWALFALFTVHWNELPVAGVMGRAALLAYRFLSFPNVVGVVVRPWVHAVPHLAAGLAVLLAIGVYRAATNPQSSATTRALVLLLVVLLLAAGASPAPREETRYVFFLYPIALILAMATLMDLIGHIVRLPVAAGTVSALLIFGGFACSEDFQPRHLAKIDTPPEIFREGMKPAMEEHLVIRTDYRAVARWLQGHRSDRTTVINGAHGLDHYYPQIDYFFVEETDPNFPDWSCQRGAVERWGNYPLLYTFDALAAKVAAVPKTYLVLFSYDQGRMLDRLAPLHPTVAMATGDVIIIELRG